MLAMMAARLGESRVGDGRIHLVETLAARSSSALIAQISLSISCSLREVGEESATWGISLHWARRPSRGRSAGRAIVERYLLGPCPGPSRKWQLGRPQRL